MPEQRPELRAASTKRHVYVVEWRDERKIVEALSPRQAIDMAVPEWDTCPIPMLSVIELVPVKEAS